MACLLLKKEKNLAMKQKNKLFLVLFIILIIAITVLSLLPPKSGLELGKSDKINHFLAYAILSLNFGFISTKIRPYFIGIPFLIAYGLLIEFFQGFVPGRDPSFYDALANSVGVFSGFFIFRLFSRIKK
jgi:glycopeptide antibiotics resistance protein